MVKTTRIPIKCILYLRLSDLRDDDLDETGTTDITFADREEELRDLAVDLGWEVVDVIIENDVMGANGRARPASAWKRKKVTLPDGSTVMRVVRPGFKKILDHFTAGRANAMLAEDLDRVLRDPRDAEDLIDLAEEKKLNCRSISGSMTITDGGTDAEIDNIRNLARQAHKESRDKARRVRNERRRQAKRGGITKKGKSGAGKRPFGWKSDRLTKIPAEAAVIEDCSRRVVQIDTVTKQRMSLRMLAAELRAGDVPKVNGSMDWSGKDLREILLRPRNAGIVVYQGEETAYKCAWEPIIDVDLFHAVKRILTDPSRRSGPGAAPKYLGSGQWRCGKCPEGTSVCQVHLGGRTARYVCKKQAHLSRNQKETDLYVQGVLMAKFAQKGWVERFVRAVTPTANVDVAALNSERKSIRENLKGLAADRALGLIDRDQMVHATEVGALRIAEIEAVLATTVVDSPLAPFLGAEDVWEVWDAQPLSQQRVIVDTLLTVTILPKISPKKAFDTNSVRIEWKTPQRRAA